MSHTVMVRGIECVVTESPGCAHCIGEVTSPTYPVPPVAYCKAAPDCRPTNGKTLVFVPTDKYIILRMKGELK